jgi:hypothetical protein
VLSRYILVGVCLVCLAAPQALFVAPAASDVSGWEDAQAVPAEASTEASAEVEPAKGDVAIELVQGKVTGSMRGQGKAAVTARLTNNAPRRLTGVRIAAYYDTGDYLPADEAAWKLHEFVLEPPLERGASVELEFTDEAAAEYIFLRVDYARLGLAIGVDSGAAITADAELLVDGPNRFISVRDLARAIGAKLELGADKRISLARDAEKPRPALWVIFTPGTVDISIMGKYAKLATASRMADGRLFVPLQETVSLLGYSANYDAAANLLSLTTR